MKKFGFKLKNDKNKLLLQSINNLKLNSEKDENLRKRIEDGGGGIFGGGKLSSHIIPDKHNFYDLGSEDFKFREIYVSAGSLHIGPHVIKSDDVGMIFPSIIKIGNATIETKDEKLTLPDTFTIGTTVISTQGGGFKVGELDTSALKIKGGITNTNQLNNPDMVIKAGDTFVYEDVLYVALKDDAAVFPDDWKRVEIRGPQGIPGIPGIPGIKGEPGPQGPGSEAATLAVAEAAAARTEAQAAAASAAAAASTITEMAEIISHLSLATTFLYNQFYQMSYITVHYSFPSWELQLNVNSIQDDNSCDISVNVSSSSSFFSSEYELALFVIVSTTSVFNNDELSLHGAYNYSAFKNVNNSFTLTSINANLENYVFAQFKLRNKLTHEIYAISEENTLYIVQQV
jgi:hypothetical protein